MKRDEFMDLVGADYVDEYEKAQLSQERTTKDATSDTISRQAVIDLLKQMRKDGDMVPWEGKDVFARIRKLPSIQPEERTEKRTESHGVCLDAISGQAAIRWVKTECNPYGKPTLDFESGKRVMKHLEQMPLAQPEQKWIPCSERMPEDCEDVLITYTHSFELTCPQETAKLLKGVKTVSGNPIDPKAVWEVPFADYIAFYDVDEKRWFSPTDNPEPFPDEIKVIAWMPLPEPYKEGETT